MVRVPRSCIDIDQDSRENRWWEGESRDWHAWSRGSGASTKEDVTVVFQKNDKETRQCNCPVSPIPLN